MVVVRTFTAVVSLDFSDDTLVKRGLTESILQKLCTDIKCFSTRLIFYRILIKMCLCRVTEGAVELTFFSQCHLVLHLFIFCKFLQEDKQVKFDTRIQIQLQSSHVIIKTHKAFFFLQAL